VSVKPDSYYTPDGDIVYITVRPANGPVTSQEEEWGLRDLDAGGELVGIEIWDASARLPADLIAALPRLEGRAVTVERQPA
jgi:uncharacterized protein YuzE